MNPPLNIFKVPGRKHFHVSGVWAPYSCRNAAPPSTTSITASSRNRRIIGHGPCGTALLLDRLDVADALFAIDPSCRDSYGRTMSWKLVADWCFEVCRRPRDRGAVDTHCTKRIRSILL